MSFKTKVLPLVKGIVAVLQYYNLFALHISMWAMVLTSCILTYSVIVRYFFRFPTDWQDEVSAILLMGIIFICSPYVQSKRGHIGIEMLNFILPKKINAWRLFFVDLISCLFCLLFSWKTWEKLNEVFVEGQTTSSTLATPLWIPVSMMAIGMSLLTLEIFLQLLTSLLQDQKT